MNFPEPKKVPWGPLFADREMRHAHEEGVAQGWNACLAEFKKLNPGTDLETLQKALQDPVRVHIAILRGEIKLPDIRSVLHTYGEATLQKWDNIKEST